jgi:hypothetical protein
VAAQLCWQLLVPAVHLLGLVPSVPGFLFCLHPLVEAWGVPPSLLGDSWCLAG